MEGKNVIDLIGIQVCIASPDDVRKWRDIIERYINEEYEAPENVVVKVVRYENDMPTTSGVDAQALINEKLIDSSDILLGMFWTKFGTPTKRADSGTEEEITRKLEKKQPVMLYFYNGPIDAQKFNQRQYSKVQKFKEKYKKQNIYLDFKDIRTLKRHLKQDLDYNIDLVIKKNSNNKIKHEITTDIKSNETFKEKKNESEITKNWYDSSITELMNSYCINRGFSGKFEQNMIFKYNVKRYNFPQDTIANEARTYAFNQKYGNYDYSKDIRNYYNNCYSQIRSLILEKIGNDLSGKSIISVASNYGIEIKKIFKDEDNVNVTALDISDVAVKRGRRQFKDINFIVGNMEKPFPINKKFDIYLNLRGIHSNGVSTNDVIIQSIKNLKPDGLAVFSISNGYLVDNGNGEYVIKEGMYSHTVKTFTENRPMELAYKVYKVMKRYGYKNCGVRSIDTEILVYGIRKNGTNDSVIIKHDMM